MWRSIMTTYLHTLAQNLNIATKFVTNDYSKTRHRPKIFRHKIIIFINQGL